MKRLASVLAVTILLVSAGNAAAKDPGKKVAEATTVYQELIATPDKAIPKELLERAQCIAVIPNVLKAAIGVGARHGDGVLVCRNGSGWSAPVFVDISGASWGLQLGAESTDLVLFFMNQNGARSLINGSHITLGGKASVAAGPFGRSGEASTNAELRAQIYSYARSKGAFAGISLEGAKLTFDKDDLAEYYGSGVTYKDVLFGNAPSNVPAEADAFRKLLP